MVLQLGYSVDSRRVFDFHTVDLGKVDIEGLAWLVQNIPVDLLGVLFGGLLLFEPQSMHIIVLRSGLVRKGVASVAQNL